VIGSGTTRGVTLGVTRGHAAHANPSRGVTLRTHGGVTRLTEASRSGSPLRGDRRVRGAGGGQPDVDIGGSALAAVMHSGQVMESQR
jgi:hypothetical protein